MRIYRKFETDRDVVFRNDDCVAFLGTLPDECVDLTITSPPYCMGKSYDDSNSVEDFIENHRQILPEVVRVTRPGGSICWQIGYHVSKGVVTPLDYLVHQIASEIEDLVLRNRIIWTFGHGLHCTNRFSGRHETVLWYTKGNEYKFDLDAVRVVQKYPGKVHYKGPNRGSPSGNPAGKNPSNVWDIPSVKSNHVEKTEHPCQYPIALAQRLILALSEPGDLVMDPYAGTATTGCAAIIEARRFAGSEIDKTFHRLGMDRLRAAVSGALKFRPMERPIETPNPKSKVARNPDKVGA